MSFVQNLINTIQLRAIVRYVWWHATVIN